MTFILHYAIIKEKNEEKLDMDFIKKASFISADPEWGSIVPKFQKRFTLKENPVKAELRISSLGVFSAYLNGKRIGRDVLAPGWTEYRSRLLYKTYDVTELLERDNEITVGVGHGWWASGMMGQTLTEINYPALIAALKICYENGEEYILTDDTWRVAKSETEHSTIYNGEVYDAGFTPNFTDNARYYLHYDKEKLIPSDGEDIVEAEKIAPVEFITTPKGELVIDFGQNLTGYVEFKVKGKRGDKIKISHAEILDSDGNFYTDNYRSARARIEYTLKDGEQTYKPSYTFFGFRYIRLDSYPGKVSLEDFLAIAVHSDIKRTGYLSSGHAKLCKLFENIIWGQLGNFLDIPTDCPQRDERCGWTGDAQVFCRTANLNFNCDRFFRKWLHDLAAAQHENGGIPRFVPNTQPNVRMESAGWGDAATVIPYEHYCAYGDKDLLLEMYPTMKGWVDYIEAHSDGYRWVGGNHFGDWLGIDAPFGSYKGATDEELIATAFFYLSTGLLVKAARVLGEDASHYEEMLPKIKEAFNSAYIKDGKMISDTQTAQVLAIDFDLAYDKDAIGKRLVELIEENGDTLTTGFLGTPYLLDALTKIGRVDKAYTLLLQEKFPSWLFSVNRGATTIWEHWDGMREDGSLWSRNMNSFNHYAYGSVAAWVYRTAAGIRYDESKPAYEHFFIEPHPDERLGSLSARLKTRYGEILSSWRYEGKTVRYQVIIPEGSCATVKLGEKTTCLGSGAYTFFTKS